MFNFLGELNIFEYQFIAEMLKRAGKVHISGMWPWKAPKWPWFWAELAVKAWRDLATLITSTNFPKIFADTDN
jgi:hypothetical protein